MSKDSLFDRARAIFLEAVEIPEADRRAWLEERCAGAADLQARVEQFLDADEPETTWSQSRRHSIGLQLHDVVDGRYRILEEIGVGGFGTVYRAEQTKPVRRDVALKVISPGQNSDGVIARFEAERQALALMDHPCVASILDGGVTGRDLPYFVMEYVQGEPITAFCQNNGLQLREQLELFARVCDAVQHAHSKGVIHRDLTPNNILVTMSGEGPMPKVIDFGIAKALDKSTVSSMTLHGEPIGTPAYMSPEQATSTGTDTRSDVYSLGVILYEMLTGTQPLDDPIMRGRDALAIQRMISEVEPERPSTRVSGRVCGSVSNKLRRDLDWVVMRCLEKQASRRYETANELAAEVRRFLNNEPVLAGPPTVSYRLQKFVRRNRVGVIASSVVILALMLGSIGVIVFALKARARQILADRARLAMQVEVYYSSLHAAKMALDSGERRAAKRFLEAVPREQRDWPWHYLHASADESLWVLDGHRSFVHSVIFAPDGSRLITACLEIIQTWQLTSEGPVLESRLFPPSGATMVSLDPTGERLAIVTLEGDVTVIRPGEPDLTLHVDDDAEKIVSVGWSPDATRLATGSDTGMLRMWLPDMGRCIAASQIHTGVIDAVAFRPDGEQVVTGSRDDTACVSDALTNEEVARYECDGRVNYAAFLDDDHLLLCDGVIECSRVSESRVVWTAQGDKDALISGMAWLGDQLAFGSDRDLHIVDTRTQRRRVFCGHEQLIYSVALSPDGSLAASGSEDGTARVWDAARPSHDQVMPKQVGEELIACSLKSGHVFFASSDDEVRVVNVDDGATVRILKTGALPRSACSDLERNQFAVGHEDGTVRVWSGPGDTLTHVCRHEAPVWYLAMSPNGSMVASRGRDLRVWDVPSGRLLWRVEDPTDSAFGPIAFSNSNSLVASAYTDHEIGIWDASSGELRLLFDCESVDPETIAFSPDDSMVGIGWFDGTVNICDSKSGRILSTVEGHEDSVRSISFNLDQTLVATSSDDYSVRVSSTHTGRELLSLRGDDLFEWVTFSNDGTQLLCVSDEGLVRTLNAIPYGERWIEARRDVASNELGPAPE